MPLIVDECILVQSFFETVSLNYWQGKTSINIINFLTSGVSNSCDIYPTPIKPSYRIMQVENVSVLPIGIVFSLFDLISGILDKIDRTIIETPFKLRKGKWCILAFAKLHLVFI